MRASDSGTRTLRDDLHTPLGQTPRPPPLSARLKPLRLWGRALALGVLAAAGGAVYWRLSAPPPQAVAIIPFDAIKTVAPPAPPAPSPTQEAVKMFPPQSGFTPGHSPQIIEVEQQLAAKLPTAPDRRLVEPSKYGLLPRVGPDGARPSDVYARPFADTNITRGAPRIAVFVGGLGLNIGTTDEAIARLPPAVSLGFAPYGAELEGAAARARDAGHETWLQAPMEGIGGDVPGPHTLMASASPAENQDALHWLMGRFPGYVGVANYLGAKFAAEAQALSPVLAEISKRGLLYLDDGTAPVAKTAEIASGVGLKAVRADGVALGDGAAVDNMLAAVETLARRQGFAIVSASALPATLDHLIPWAQALGDKGFTLVPVSTLARGRAK